MFTVLVFIISFICIVGLIKLSTNKFSKYIINKITIDNTDFNYIEKIQMRFSKIVMCLDPIFLVLFMFTESMTILAVMTIINIILIISMGSFSKLKNSMNE
ncbi:hypothetical protein LL037_25115 (plasmid) [Clostridium estertheticum]|uniref:hypothetical protein n=1 Tax=Clostridium estertheticum TaxID=238834 RepID=UPI001C0DF4AA|nr:hypothetical protein [Clostridium estertheticum]MBU3201787.1 hypothetical protein [Clostridium estertheticum]WAG68182.1 hypothetical protein LL037_25115 [Clostridium estertheticum]